MFQNAFAVTRKLALGELHMGTSPASALRNKSLLLVPTCFLVEGILETAPQSMAVLFEH